MEVRRPREAGNSSMKSYITLLKPLTHVRIPHGSPGQISSATALTNFSFLLISSISN